MSVSTTEFYKGRRFYGVVITILSCCLPKKLDARPPALRLEDDPCDCELDWASKLFSLSLSVTPACVAELTARSNQGR